jgi:hypothetical protein
VVVTDWVVGAAGAADAITSIRFSLSENEVAVPVVLRAQPSGTFTEKAGPLNVTNAWLSGMSPGGFDSVTTGLGGPLLAGGAGVDGPDVDGGADDWVDDGVWEVPPGLAAEPDEPPPLQADSSTALVSETVNNGQIFMDHPRESGHRLPSTLETPR